MTRSTWLASFAEACLVCQGELSMKYLVFSLITFSLLGCAGSPLHTSSMSPSELLAVDTYTLCKAYTPREQYSPSYAVITEVRRRGIDCARIYRYQSMTPAVQAATSAYDSIYGGTSSSNQKTPSPPAGYRACVYRAGSVVWTETVLGICPVSSYKGGLYGALQK